jgi:hypothetical protein
MRPGALASTTGKPGHGDDNEKVSVSGSTTVIALMSEATTSRNCDCDFAEAWRSMFSYTAFAS